MTRPSRRCRLLPPALLGPPAFPTNSGTVYYKKGDYLKAADSLKQAVADDPNDKEAVQLLGLSYYLAGRPAEAIPYLEKVQTWYPRANVDASYILGISYIQAKDYPNACKAFAKMFDVPADSGAAYLVTATDAVSPGIHSSC